MRRSILALAAFALVASACSSRAPAGSVTSNAKPGGGVGTRFPTQRAPTVAPTGSVPAGAYLVIPDPVVKFGKARTGTKTLPFEIRNAGTATLRYQVSNDRFYISLDNAAGAVAPGTSMRVKVTYDYDAALDGAREVPLNVTSNGGAGVVTVLGETDSVGPRGRNNDMTFLHAHADGKRWRHAEVDFTDGSGVRRVRLQWWLCQGVPPTAPVCGDFHYADMKRLRGDTWWGEVGPLAECPGGEVQVIVEWRTQAEDGLGNRQFFPGSAARLYQRDC